MCLDFIARHTCVICDFAPFPRQSSSIAVVDELRAESLQDLRSSLAVHLLFQSLGRAFVVLSVQAGLIVGIITRFDSPLRHQRSQFDRGVLLFLSNAPTTVAVSLRASVCFWLLHVHVVVAL